MCTSSYPHQFYKRRLYKAKPQRAVAGGAAGGVDLESFTEEAIEIEGQRGQGLGNSWRYMAGGALQKEAIKGESSEDCVWGAAGGI